MLYRFLTLLRNARCRLVSLPSAFRASALFVAFSIATAGLLFMAGCHRSTPAQIYVASFLGNQACASCHQKEFESHRDTHHAVTLRAIDSKGLDRLPLVTGQIAESAFALYENGSGFSFGWKDKTQGALPLQLALGSEKIAYTFVNTMDGHSLTEFHESYHPSSKAWHITPGHEDTDTNTLGKVYDERIARHCLGCHAVVLPTDSVTPEPKFYGVGCESCHGPGQNHVEAVKSGNMGDLKMEKLGSLGAEKLNRVCGKCHRNADDIAPDQSDMTQRFAAYGTSRSRCFREGGDKLTCIRCHDPHTNVSTDKKRYEQVCLSCHTAKPASFGPSEGGKACPINPKTGCIPCHMPRRAAGPGIFADHYIHVFTKQELGTR